MDAIDHVVVAVPALASAAAWFRDAGFTVSPGGRHDELPTENALVVFGDGSYLELLATRESGTREEWRTLARGGAAWPRHLRGVSALARRFLPSLAGDDGVVDACLHGARLAARAADLRRVGERSAGPVRMSRERRDGVRLEWELLLPESRRLPFWIADRTPRAQRVPASPEATVHANGARGVSAFALRAAGAPLAALAIGDLFGAVPATRPDGGAWLATPAFGIEVREGAPEGICGATIAGCGPLPAPLRALGLANG